MSWTEDPSASGPGRPPESQARSRGAKIVVAAIVVVVLVIFVLKNSQPVTLDFVVTSGHPRLIWLIVGCVLIGIATGYFLGRPPRRRAPKPEENRLGTLGDSPGGSTPPKRR
ncbi:MAG TPA: LapA family protein [Actinomycetota bacterium]|nr:LapA family protein [Actinomycetota bacterium]